MKAIVYRTYGSPDVLEYTTAEEPTPAANEVLIRVRAASVNKGDWHLLHGEPFLVRPSAGLRRPKHPILGADVAGEVVAAGRAVTRFQPGDAVFGDLSASGRGGFAEFVAAPQDVLALKPPAIPFTDAAATPTAGVTALQGLRTHGRIAPGQQVLINGASGGVGTFAVQIARALGATVTAVCSTRNAAQARRLGANHVIDYTQEDFTQSGQRFDLIFDTVGNRSVAEYRQVLVPQGRFVTTTYLPALALLGPWLAWRGGPSMQNMMAKPNRADLEFLAELLDAGNLTPVIDRCFPLAEAPAALRYVGAGHARGKVVIVAAAGDTSARTAAHAPRDAGARP